MSTEIFAAPNDELRVTCAGDCVRPLDSIVTTSRHAINLAAKHEREWHGDDGLGELVELLQSRAFGGRELNDVQASEIAAFLVALGYAKPPM